MEWIRDDAVYFPMDRYTALRPYAAPRSVLSIWIDEFEGAYADGGLFQLTMHPHVIGHRSRMAVLAELIEHISNGYYALEAKTTQTVTLERPFPVTIALASLTTGLHRYPPTAPLTAVRSSAAPPGTRIRADAQRLACPVLFLANWDDTRVPREQAFELLDLIGSEDKRLHVYPGEHGQLPEEARAASEDFLARYLAGLAGLPRPRCS